MTTKHDEAMTAKHQLKESDHQLKERITELERELSETKSALEAANAEIEDLKRTETVYYMNRDWIAEAKIKLSKLESENSKLRAALEFYADETNWNFAYRADIQKFVLANSEGTSVIEEDKGDWARVALKSTTPQGDE